MTSCFIPPTDKDGRYLSYDDCMMRGVTCWAKLLGWNLSRAGWRTAESPKILQTELRVRDEMRKWGLKYSGSHELAADE